MRRLFLVVARGPDAGSSFELDESERFLGRGLEADLLLRDPRVSRRQLSIRVVGEEAIVEACSGATPLVHHGASCRSATLRLGETLVVGDTALVLHVGEVSVPPPIGVTGAATTAVGALMTGLAADVRGLAAVVSLVDALDVAENEAAISQALGSWGKEYLGAIRVALLRDEAIRAALGDVTSLGGQLIEREEDSGVRLSALASVGGPAWLSFTCEIAPAEVTQTVRRLVVVSARLCASALARVRRQEVSDEENLVLRTASVGSARAFLGASEAAKRTASLIPRLAASDVNVLIGGETGVGKTFFARLIHEASPRAAEPLRVINCAAIPESLLESELFGHERGAFTGANAARAGAFESAGRGTLLLDEIGELSLANQAKLLRVLEDRHFERIGSNRSIRLEARVVCATNRDLEQMTKEGRFRSDLLFRVSVVRVEVPALRDRGDDLVLLAQGILADLTQSGSRRVTGFSAGAVDVLLRRYPWPGNVRELRNALEHALVLGEESVIQPTDFPSGIQGAVEDPPDRGSSALLLDAVDAAERQTIERALQASGGNRTRAAALLGITRMTLYNKLRRM